ncbi:MAG: polyprenol monophosphomannose synthase [Candidatus Coatesbacteria bacterium]|nr:polyprenol monophosphomannose synthase [Candidatus Coatesbacteria bacterium]
MSDDELQDAASRAVVVIPTYNEHENLSLIISHIHRLYPSMSILIVDDNSPDGTGELADDLALSNDRIDVIHRQRKMGLGTAYIAGFKYAIEKGFSYIIQMDADLSHSPDYLAVFLEEINDCDFILGSRYIEGINVIHWDLWRVLLSLGASLYCRVIGGLNVTDATGGFKCWRREVLESINLEAVQSTGYSFQIEMTHRAQTAGFRLKEVPIVFIGRYHGTTKMSKRIVWEAIWMVWRLRLGLYRR